MLFFFKYVDMSINMRVGNFEKQTQVVERPDILSCSCDKYFWSL